MYKTNTICLINNSIYTSRIMQLKAAGLLDLWEKHYQASPRKCLEFNQEKKESRLSIANLSSAFVVLFIGYALSIFILLIEKIFSLTHRNKWYELNEPIKATYSGQWLYLIEYLEKKAKQIVLIEGINIIVGYRSRCLGISSPHGVVLICIFIKRQIPKLKMQKYSFSRNLAFTLPVYILML